jgi:hypothetical protein
VQLDGPDPPLKEAKDEEETGAVEGGLKTFADKAGKDDAFKAWGLDFARRNALPIWTGMSDADKAASITWGAATVGVGLGALLSDPLGREKLSGVNIGAPLSLVPYAILTAFPMTCQRRRPTRWRCISASRETTCWSSRTRRPVRWKCRCRST